MYKIVNSKYFNFHFNLVDKKTDICLTIASFSFTLLGFLAAAITIFFGISGKRFVNRYRKNGHLTTFIMFYFFSIICLFLTFGLSVVSLGRNAPVVLFDVLTASLVNNFIHALLLTYIVIHLAHKGTGKPTG